jgi:hypothetical protein
MKNKSFLRTSLAAMLLVAVVSSGVALATDSFSDVPDGQFYTEAVAWAKANGMTTGSPAGADTFKPLDGVTRGENITFAKRYDDIVVQPALATLTASVATNATGVATNAADIAMNGSVVAQSVVGGGLDSSTAVVTSVDLTLPDVCPEAPDSWSVLVLANGYFLTSAGGSGGATIGLSLTSTDFETGSIQNQNFDSTGQFREAYSTTFLFTVDAGTTTFFELGSETHTASVTAAQNNLIAQSVSVTC